MASTAKTETLPTSKSLLAKNHTTVRSGGTLHEVFTPDSADELSALRKRSLQNCDCPLVLGLGSNLLVSDEGVRTPVVQLAGEFKTWEADGSTLLVGGAFPLMRLSRIAGELGLSGLEFAAGIPGSLGGAVRMNAGAHGGEMSSLVREAEVSLPGGEIDWIPASELSFGYRSSTLPAGAIITRARLHLTPGESTQIEKNTRANLDYRKKTQPLQFPSFGSVFTNPAPDITIPSHPEILAPISAGKLVELAGCKGHTIGSASISEMHANWIVNPSKDAETSDVVKLLRHAREAVRERYGIVLCPEVVYWSDGESLGELLSSE